MPVLALSLLAGCNHFQTAETSKWLEMGFHDPNNQRASHILTFWDNQVRLTQDSANGGRALAGMAGKLYLLNEESGKAIDATGRVVVQMQDMTNLQSGQTPRTIAEWTFDPISLKRLKRQDGISQGYSLFLPWEDYRPEVKQVQIRVCYIPDEKAPPFFAEPSVLTLRGEEPPPVMQERVVPVSNLVPKR